jgi:hypothetical protein
LRIKPIVVMELRKARLETLLAKPYLKRRI